MNLLYIDRPLVINPALAEKIGLNEAIVLQQMHYWLSKSNSGKEHDGRVWIYNTYEQWIEQFPFWSESTIKRIITSLKNNGLIKVKQLKKQAHNRTNYYTIVYENPDLLDKVKMTRSIVPKRPDPQVQNGTLSTETTAENTTIVSKQVSQSAKADIVDDLFNFWCQTMSKNTNSSKLTPKRAKAIKSRLDDGYTVSDIKTAILGCSQDAFSMGANDRKKPFNDIELICRSGEKLEGFRDSYRPVKQQKQIQAQATQPTKLDSLSPEEQERERQAAQLLIDQLRDI